MFLIAMFLIGAETWTHQNTGIYHRLLHHLVAADDRGDFYVANLQTAEILKIDSSGRTVSTFGGRGRGPGELSGITSLQYNRGRVYAVDQASRSVSVFSREGTPLFASKVPFVPVRLFPTLYITDHGWFHLSANSRALMMSSERFETTTMFIGSDDGEPTERPDPARYNPTPERLLFAVDLHRQRMVVAVPEDGFQIREYALESLAEVRRITTPGTRTEFDEAYGLAQLRTSLERNQGTALGNLRYRPDFPDFFPSYSWLRIYPNGVLHLFLGNPLLPSDRRHLFYDAAYEPIPAVDLGKLTAIVARVGAYELRARQEEDGHVVLEKVAQTDDTNP